MHLKQRSQEQLLLEPNNQPMQTSVEVHIQGGSK